MCGEQAYPGYARMPITGSPPRVRGTAITEAEAANIFGITPACAGNRSGPGPYPKPPPDHPRVCGEQHSARCRHLMQMGSPPRVRGTAQGRRR